MAPETASSSHAGVKRPYASSVSDPLSHKKRRIHHALQHVQNRPRDIEPAPQDPIFAQGQLLKSIGAALVLAGFDSVKPTALEMFRSHVEEYMLHFLGHARTSMQDGRRTIPTALDFASALAQTPNTSSASLLNAQLSLQLPEEISCPSISDPDPAPQPAPDFSNLLAPLLEQQPRKWIPQHFPSLPPRHAWESTPVFPEREKDARKMREKATEEGMLAEQALRKLAAAAKTSAMNAEKRRNCVLSGEGKTREGPKPRRGRKPVHDDTFGDVLNDMGMTDEVLELGMNGTAEVAKDGIDLGMPDGVAVNHDMSHWRRAGGSLRK